MRLGREKYFSTSAVSFPFWWTMWTWTDGMGTWRKKAGKRKKLDSDNEAFVFVVEGRKIKI